MLVLISHHLSLITVFMLLFRNTHFRPVESRANLFAD